MATSTTWSKPATTTKVETTTTSKVETTTTTTTATTEAPKPTATCPATAGTPFPASGSCECSYAINCGVKATPGKGAKFWERKSGELVDSLDACIAICDENSSCTAVLYVDEPTAGPNDYKHCWQTSGLPQPDGTGYAKISYKGACSGSCSAGYNTPQ
ncbi:hypothetical protein OHC33_004761 [Knufia fluminis]|uniref:Apple domain-containing protein n=1 Tax=Knufia fluminis TaxID=191047 RepID=A0AAN8ELP5_9EURO|nr:hypothetical protein OHC33_004761 [Knufia fluminis]